MACSNTTVTSSGSSGTNLQNSGSGEDERKRKRMLSNRESARRSRTRKQKHLDDLMAQMGQLRTETNQIITSMNTTTQLYLRFESENSILKAHVAELSHRLQSMNEIIDCVTSCNHNGLQETEDLGIGFDDSFLNPCALLNSVYMTQAIMANQADMFMY